jgi:hypothetical protein
MSLELPFGIKVLDDTPLDALYGPYADTAAAIAAIPQAIRYDGLTVQITGTGEYHWLAADLSDTGLVVKGGGGSLTNGSGTTANGTAVDLGGTLTGDVTIDGNSGTYKVTLEDVLGLSIKNVTSEVFIDQSSVNGQTGSAYFSFSPESIIAVDASSNQHFYSRPTFTQIANSLFLYDNASVGKNKILSKTSGGFTDTPLEFDATSILIPEALTASSGHELLLRTNGSNGQAITKLGIGSGLSISGGNLVSSGGFSDPMTTRGDLIYRNASNVTARLGAGTANQVLTSDGTDIAWAAPSAGALSALTAATGSNTINNAANAQQWQWNTLGAGTGLLLSSSSTAAASNTQTVFRVNQTGANATSTQTTYSGYFSNTKTGTSSTNIASYFTASGATNNVGVDISVTPAAATFGLRTTGRTILGGGANGETFFGSTSNSYILTPATNRTEFWSTGPSNQAVSTWLFTTYATSTTTANHQNYFRISHQGFAPTSGTGTQNFLDLAWTINQTGGASGIVVGVKVEPTHTSTADFIAFDYNPVSGTPTSDLSFRATQGNMLIPASSYINFGTTSGTTGYGLRDNAGVMEFKNSGGAWTPL